ncbi:MAG TPA: hypothetical protein VLV16_02155 [Gemmatimonadales bacterium]|nr:hypothetical protein [Gemmatimonadales bacterium]
MSWFKAISGRPGDAQRRIGALFGVWALLAQAALPQLHDWAVSRDLASTVQGSRASTGSTPRLAATSRRSPLHDASDCPVCRTLVHGRRFLSAPAPTLAAAPQVHAGSTMPAAVVASRAIALAASPRAPPRRA